MKSQTKPWVVAIGASGGEGLHDIREILAALPPTLPAIVLIVLHRPFHEPSELASVLAQSSKLPIVTAAQQERFQIGTAYIGEPAEHLTLAANSFGILVDDPDRVHRNRTVDLLFRSVAEHSGTRTIGVVLSGSLDDGSRGLAAINKAGGVSMVLTARPAQGVPENAINYDGPIDIIGNPSEIASAICSAVENRKHQTAVPDRGSNSRQKR
ncbi:MAG: chemotaxis protein CheB [Rhodomicrobium sp.]